MKRNKLRKELSLALKLLPALISTVIKGCASQRAPNRHKANISIYNRHRHGIGQYINSKVRSVLHADTIIKNLPITVKTYKGIVQLSGFVYDLYQKKKAVLLAMQVKGVREVKDMLVVIKYKH